MVTFFNPGFIWSQLASFFFLGSCFVGHILLVRLCLVCAYIFLIVNAACGLPSWEQGTHNGDFIALDLLIWASLSFFFQLIAFIRHLIDELPLVKLKTDPDEEAVWRYFYRTSGMERFEFRSIIRKAEWIRFEKGQEIYNVHTLRSYGFMIIEGIVKLYDDKLNYRATLRSGRLFDFYLWNIFGVKIGFDCVDSRAFAETDILLLKWSLHDLNEMARNSPLSVPIAWRNCILYQVSLAFNAEIFGSSVIYDSLGDRESDEFMHNGARSRDFEPFTEEEIAYGDMIPWYVRVIYFIKTYFNFIPPPGLMRHNPMPENSARMTRRMEILARSENVDAVRIGVLGESWGGIEEAEEAEVAPLQS